MLAARRSAVDLVVQRVESSPGISLGRPVKRALHGLNSVEFLDTKGAVSRDGTQRYLLTGSRGNELAALPYPAVLLSARLDQYYGRLRRPPSLAPTW